MKKLWAISYLNILKGRHLDNLYLQRVNKLMKMELKSEINIENAHYRNQQGMYFSDYQKISGAVLLYSNKIEDFFWNYAAQVNVNREKVPQLIDTIIKFYRLKNRQPCIYITSSTKPSDLSEHLKNRGFELQFSDAWMLYEARSISEIEIALNFSIKIVKTKDAMKTFVKVFNESYGRVPSEDEPYGGLPSYYGEALYESYLKPQDNKKITHFLGFIGRRAVGIATLISSEKGYGSIYNVGTSPKYRGKGIGSALSMKAVKDSIRQGNKTLFLQTEAGSHVEKFYINLGFNTKFIGEGYVLSN